MKKTTQLQFTPEQELLLWSIRVDYTKDQRIADILSKKVDWNYVRETAIQHGIIPLLYKRLKEEMSDFVPSHELLELRTLFIANAVQNLRMTQQLIRVLDLLADAGIEAMPFKGPALAVQVYGDPSMRSFCDLDILIHEKDFEKMYEILIIHGYFPRYQVNSKMKRKLTILKKDLSFSKGPLIEVHWKITERSLCIPINIEEFWARTDQIYLNDKKLITLSVEDSVILLCIHGTKHFWHEIKWIADLIHLIKNYPNIRWNEIIYRSKNMGVKNILILGLFLAQEYGGSKFPVEIKNLFECDNNLLHHTNIIKNCFFNPMNSISNFTLMMFYLQRRERIIDRLNYGSLYIVTKFINPKQSK